MADDDMTEAGMTDSMPEAHGDVRSRFVELWNERTSGDAGAVALDAAWQPIANLLDGHASADETAAHQVLPKQDGDEAPKQINHAHPAE